MQMPKECCDRPLEATPCHCRSKPKQGTKLTDKRSVRFTLPSTRRPAAPRESRPGDWRCPCGNVNFASRFVASMQAAYPPKCVAVVLLATNTLQSCTSMPSLSPLPGTSQPHAFLSSMSAHSRGGLGRRATCNTCRQPKLTREAGAHVASCKAATSSRAAENNAAGAASVAGSPTLSGTDIEQAQPAPARASLQPGFVDFAALSRRIFGSPTGATEADPPASSCTYEAAAAAMPEATTELSAVHAAAGDAQSSPAASSQPQRSQSRTYEAAALHSAGDIDEVASTASHQTAALALTDSITRAHADIPAPVRVPAPIRNKIPSHVESATVPHKHRRGAARTQQPAAQPGALSARTSGPAAAAPALPAATSEEDNSTTNSDTDGSRRRRSHQQPTASPVNQLHLYILAQQ